MVCFYVPIGITVSKPPIVLTYLGSQQNTSGSGTTHPGMNTGTPAFNRYIVAVIGQADGAVTAGCNIDPGSGNIAMTLCTAVRQGGGSTSAIFIALVPTGTTADVTIVPGSGGGVSSVALYSLVNLASSTPTAVANGTTGGSPSTMSCAVLAGGVLIATAYATGAPAASASWSGLTTTDLNLRFGGGSEQHSCGNFATTAPVTDSLSVSLGGIINLSSCCAAFF